MKTFRAIAGYVLGGIMFVVLLPTIMWLASGMPALEHIGALRASITGVLIIGGLTLSVWTIIYMKRQGKGNPMDAFDHEIGPRTQHLMTDGPYRLNRNPMLTGTFIYLLGYIVWLWTWQALLVWLIFVAIMIVQVLSEEKRLRRDFSDEYKAYCKRTGRFLPFYIFLAAMMSASVMASDVKIDKENCTITKDGKTYKLYGKVKVVDSFEDIKVKLVDAFEDADIKIVDNFEDSCGKVKIVEHFEDVKVKIVDSFEDIKIKLVEHFEGVKR